MVAVKSAASYRPQRLFVVSDVANATATPVSLSDLTFNLTSGASYWYQAFLLYQGDTAAASPITLSWVSPALTTGSVQVYIQNSISGKNEYGLTTLAGTVTGGNVTSAATNYNIVTTGVFVAGASGALTPRFASNGANTNTVKASSWAFIQRIN